MAERRPRPTGPRSGASHHQSHSKRPQGSRPNGDGRNGSPRPTARPAFRPVKNDGNSGKPPRVETGQRGPSTSNGVERLQKVLAQAGLGSRRACEELIAQGRVTINGEVAKELGVKVDPSAATIHLDGQRIKLERHVYYAVHKPKGYVASNHDPAGKPLVVDLLSEVPQRVYTVGRLDEQSTGLILLTNDGDLANKLAHPKFGVEKIYRVVVAGEPSRDVLDQLTKGIWLAEGKVRAKRVRIVGQKGQASVLEMVLAEGKNREIRRMLAKLGHKVMSLTRIAVGPVGLKGLGVGECRPLSARELDLLRQVASGVAVPSPKFPDRRPRISRPGAPIVADGPPPPPRQQSGPSRRSATPASPEPIRESGPGYRMVRPVRGQRPAVDEGVPGSSRGPAPRRSSPAGGPVTPARPSFQRSTADNGQRRTPQGGHDRRPFGNGQSQGYSGQPDERPIRRSFPARPSTPGTVHRSARSTPAPTPTPKPMVEAPRPTPYQAALKEGAPQRRVIGLEPENSGTNQGRDSDGSSGQAEVHRSGHSVTNYGGPAGPRRKRPGPKRPPRAAVGLQRTPKKPQGSNE